ncbi:MAG: hypothetical protein GXP37_08655 [Chloroflexi bacterium]|nr:hypothetical protein [Chloroflexota bacterium]
MYSPTPASKAFTRDQRLLLLLIVLGAFGLRLVRLGVDSLWYDETVSALLSSQSLTEMWAHTAGDIHPPLYYGLLHFWTLAAGRSEFAYAFLSLIFGMALVPLLAQLGRRLFSPPVGILAALLYAVNPFAIWYAQEVRMYTLAALLLTSLMWLTWAFLQRPTTAPWRRLGLIALLAALALWTLYYTAFALVALNLFALVWLWRHAKKYLPAWLLAQMVTLVLYAPWLPIALRQALQPPVPAWRQAVSGGQLALTMLRQSSVALALGQSIDAMRWWPVGILLLGIALVPVIRRQSKEYAPGAACFLASILGGPLLLIFLISQLLTPLYHVRYVYLISAAYPLLVAAGWLQLTERLFHTHRRWRHAATAGFLGLLLLPTALSLRNYNTDRFAYEAADDLRGAVQYIYERIGPRDAILVNAGYLYPALLTYWPGEIGWLGRLTHYPPPAAAVGPGPLVITTGHIDGDPGIGWGDAESDFYAVDHATAGARLAQVFADFNTVWLLRGYDTVNDPRGFIRSWLQQHGSLMNDQVFAGQTYVRVQAWRTVPHRRTQAPPFAHPLAIDFASGIRLLGYDLTPDTLIPGRPLRLTLYWQATGASDRSWKVFTQVLNADWQVQAQADALPLAGARPTDQWQEGEIVESTFILHPPADLSPGDYRLITGFYDESSGERLPLATGEDFISLRQWQIQP